MRRENTGIVFTNDNCIGCNRCIAGCPVPGANIAQNRNGKNRIVVDGEACIHCGHCLSVCRHSAREYLDDTDTFFTDLEEGKSISAAVDPAFYIDYPELAYKIIGYLKRIGVKKIYNTSFGADIATWASIHWFREHSGKSGIIHSCSALVNYFEKYNPQYLNKLVPVHSPLICTAVYVHTCLGDTNNIAYISPCIAAKDEISAPDICGLVQYNVTFQHLLKRISGIRLDGLETEPDIGDSGLGVIYPIPGGIKENFGHFLGYERAIISLPDTPVSYPLMGQYIKAMNDGDNPLVVESMHCGHGCVAGSGTEGKLCCMQTILEQYQIQRIKNSDTAVDSDNPFSKAIPRLERVSCLDRRFKKLDINDFYCTYHRKYRKPGQIPQETYKKIFSSMLKNSRESRHIDCQACGYRSCRQMVAAIADGYNTISNCVQYEKKENVRLYTTNHMTGLPNTFVFMQEIDRMLAQNRTTGYSVLHFNIKNFMLINNILGFGKGSKILVDFAGHIKEAAGKDDRVYHDGGDNFFAIIKNERVNKFLFQINHLDLPALKQENSEIRTITVRCGVYRMDGTEKDVSSIDNRMNAAYMITKRNKNTDTAFYDQSISTNIVNAMVISQQIPDILANRELFVVYQPKVRVTDNTLTGAEALVRWKHEGKIISPGDFIPICESTGFIRRIDFYVLNQVCSKLAVWVGAGLNTVTVSVNFSKLHFSQTDIAERICNIIDKWALPHNLIEIEFTETSFNDMKDSLVATINSLKKNGISSSIDDFGTGYSSLNLLQELDFDILKLDKSLVDVVKPDTRAQKIVTNIVRMAKDLHMEIVAEGVETRDKLALLKDLKCDTVQGYIFDKPLSESDFEQRLKNKKYA